MLAFFITIALSLAGSFLCSLCEAALYSVTDVRVGAMVAESRPGARLLQKLRANLDRAIAAILTINTLTHTAGASVGGAIIGQRFNDTWVGIFTGAFTVVLLLATEIIPKSLGATRADYFAPRIAWMIHAMIIATYPIVIVCEFVARAVNRSREVVAPTEHEILAMTRLAARHGEMEIDTARVVHNAIKLDRIPVRDIMTPRSVVFALSDRLPLSMIEQHSEHWTHSRLPLVRDNNPNEVVGIVHRRDVFDILVRDDQAARTKTLADLKRPVQFIRDDVPADEVLQKFLAGRQHMFIVVDEFGLWIGIVTLEDVLEQLLGKEIVGEHDPVTNMQELALKKAEAVHGGRVIEASGEDEPVVAESDATDAEDALALEDEASPHESPSTHQPTLEQRDRADELAGSRSLEEQLTDDVPIALPPPGAGAKRPRPQN